MVAYSFQRQFEDPIRSKAKRHTVRADRKRHAHSGETLQLYVGMRTRQCRLLGLARCDRVTPIRINLHDFVVEFDDQVLDRYRDLDAFARSDGFAGGWDEMRRFWAAQHKGITRFSGVMIAWGDSFQAPAQEIAA